MSINTSYNKRAEDLKNFPDASFSHIIGIQTAKLESFMLSVRSAICALFDRLTRESAKPDPVDNTRIFLEDSRNSILYRNPVALYSTVEKTPTELDDKKKRLLNKLQNREPIGQEAVKDISDIVFANRKDVEISTICLFPHTANEQAFSNSFNTIKNVEDKKHFFFPVVLKGTFRDHIVLFYVDKERNTINFYDPKGQDLADRLDDQIAGRDMTIREMFKLLRDGCLSKGLLQNNFTLEQDTKRVQKDGHNCGIYVLKAMEEFANGTSLGEVVRLAPSYAEADTTERGRYCDIINGLDDYVIEYGKNGLLTRVLGDSYTPSVESYTPPARLTAESLIELEFPSFVSSCDDTGSPLSVDDDVGSVSFFSEDEENEIQ